VVQPEVPSGDEERSMKTTVRKKRVRRKTMPGRMYLRFLKRLGIDDITPEVTLAGKRFKVHNLFMDKPKNVRITLFPDDRYRSDDEILEQGFIEIVGDYLFLTNTETERAVANFGSFEPTYLMRVDYRQGKVPRIICKLENHYVFVPPYGTIGDIIILWDLKVEK
jgi:hypothetical protein